MKKTNFCYAVLTASAVLALGSAFTASAAGWELYNSEWVYVENSGDYAKDAWKLDDGKYYYLGSDGYMVRSTLIEDNDSYYYVNSAGVMCTNEWKFIENPSWQGDDLVGEASWYYFGSNGRACRTTSEKVEIDEIGGKKYAFDQYGRMLTGWISENGELVSDEEWQDGYYYADGEGDGSLVTNAWVYITVTDEDNEDDTEPTYHFYFGSNGKKTVSTEKTIGDHKYQFDERGVAVYGWQEDDEDGWKYYGDMEEPYLHTGWFQAIPDENMHASAYSDGTSYWYYASSQGVLATNELKTIDSKIYCFNSNSELVTGLRAVTMEDGSSKKIASISGSIDNVDSVPSGDDERVLLYFSSDGSVKTGVTTISLDGTNYTFSFKSSGTPKGAGVTGSSDGYLYDHGLRLTADEGSKYQVVTLGEHSYVVNESGSIQKNKKNLKDADGYYWCTDKNGYYVHGPLYDKCTETTHVAE